MKTKKTMVTYRETIIVLNMAGWRDAAIARMLGLSRQQISNDKRRNREAWDCLKQRIKEDIANAPVFETRQKLLARYRWHLDRALSAAVPNYHHISILAQVVSDISSDLDETPPLRESDLKDITFRFLSSRGLICGSLD